MASDGRPETLAELSQLMYKDQAIWFLNGFWCDADGNWVDGAVERAEVVWGVVKTFIELDTAKGEEGNELDEFNSHRVLEKYDQTLSAIKMREALREIDQDANGHMSLIEYLIWRFKVSPAECMASPQGENKEEIEACEAALEEVMEALEDVTTKMEAQRAALAEQEAALQAQNQAIAELDQAIAANDAALAEQQAAVAANEAKLEQQKAAVAEADAAYQEVKAAEDEVRAAEAELQAAVDELKAQEDAYNAKIAELEAKSTDTSIGIVTRNKAAAELSQLKAEDPLPLRRAKITAEAKVRPVTKAREAAEAKTAVAEEKKVALEKVEAELAETQRELEVSYAELEGKMAEAEAALAEAKQKGGVAHGNLWWMGRQMYEADESLPRAKQKYDHSKPFEYSS